MQWPCNDKAPEGTPIMHVGEFVRGKGKFFVTEYVPTDEKTGPRFPLLLTTGRICRSTMSARRRGAPRSRLARGGFAGNPPPRRRTTRHPRWRLGPARSRAGATRLRAKSPIGGAGRRLHDVPPPDTRANVVTTEYSDWATNCPEYKVTAVQVSPSNGPSEWQEEYEQFSRQSRRIAPAEAAE